MDEDSGRRRGCLFLVVRILAARSIFLFVFYFYLFCSGSEESESGPTVGCRILVFVTEIKEVVPEANNPFGSFLHPLVFSCLPIMMMIMTMSFFLFWLSSGTIASLAPADLKKLKAQQRKAAKKAEQEKQERLIQEQKERQLQSQPHQKRPHNQPQDKEPDAPPVDDLLPQKLARVGTSSLTFRDVR